LGGLNSAGGGKVKDEKGAVGNLWWISEKVRNRVLCERITGGSVPGVDGAQLNLTKDTFAKLGSEGIRRPGQINGGVGANGRDTPGAGHPDKPTKKEGGEKTKGYFPQTKEPVTSPHQRGIASFDAA